MTLRFTVGEYNQIAAEVGAPRQFRGGVITVHGFNTTGWWQKLLVPTLQRAGLFYTPADYGHVLPGIFRPKTQDKVAEAVMDAYREQLAEPGCERPGVIAHSLGSLGLGWALKTRESLKVGRVIVNGCILPRDFPWSELASPPRYQVERVLNEGGGKDTWPRVARMIVPRAGHAGVCGFDDDGTGLVVNRINRYGRHSDVHNIPHFRQVWVPFLLTGHYTK
jgi:hypothetical protein